MSSAGSLDLPADPPQVNAALGWFEVMAAFGVVEASIWTEQPWHNIWFWVAAVWVFGITLIHHPPAKELGLGLSGLRRSLWIAAAGTGVAGAICLGGYFAGTLHKLYGALPIVYHASMYATWAIVQQFILQSFFFYRLERVLHSGMKAALVASLLFCAAHVPNPVLVPVTLVAGLITCALFRRYRNIYPLGIAHGLVGLAIAISVPDTVLHHMRVGIGYVHYFLR